MKKYLFIIGFLLFSLNAMAQGTQKINGLRFTPKAAPGTPIDGEVYYDSTTKKTYQWNGTSWIDWSGGGGAGSDWGTITGTIANQTDLQNELNAKAGLAATQTFTGSNTFTTSPTINNGTISTVNLKNTTVTGHSPSVGYGAVYFKDNKVRFATTTGAVSNSFNFGMDLGGLTTNTDLIVTDTDITYNGSSLLNPTAAQVTSSPIGNIAATNVQSAINELETEKGGLANANSWLSANSFTASPRVQTYLSLLEGSATDQVTGYSAISHWAGNRFRFEGANQTFASFLDFPDTMAADRTYTFQPASGTVAFLSDITGTPSPNSVTSAMIVDETITTADIGNNQITSIKIGAGQVKGANIDVNAITGSNLSPNVVTIDKIAPTVVTEFSNKTASEEVTTTTYTPTTADLYKIKEMKNASTITVLTPTGTYTAGQTMSFQQTGAGKIQFDFLDAITNAYLRTTGIGAALQIRYTGTAWKFMGNLESYTPTTAIGASAPKYDFNAQLLSTGALASWANSGTGIATAATQGTGANQPTVIDESGKKAVSFDGVNDVLTLGTPADLDYVMGTDVFTIIIVRGSTVATTGTIFGDRDATDRNFNIGTTVNTNFLIQLGQSGQFFETVSSTGRVILEIKNNGATADTYNNGVISQTAQTVSTETIAQNVFNIGAREGGTSFYNGSIRRILLWNRLLTTQERTDIVAQLQSEN